MQHLIFAKPNQLNTDYHAIITRNTPIHHIDKYLEPRPTILLLLLERQSNRLLTYTISSGWTFSAISCN